MKLFEESKKMIMNTNEENCEMQVVNEGIKPALCKIFPVWRMLLNKIFSLVKNLNVRILMGHPVYNMYKIVDLLTILHRLQPFCDTFHVFLGFQPQGGYGIGSQIRRWGTW